MKPSRLIPVLIIPLLFACLPKKPEIPMTEVPAEPLVQALEQHSRAFSSLKALASIQAVRKDRKRAFDSVGVLVNGSKQFKIEAYSPLGQAVTTLVWAGKDIVLDNEGERRIVHPHSAALERVLGADIDPAELCAVLSGNIPGDPASYHALMRCAQNGSCVLDLSLGDIRIEVHPDIGWEPSEGGVPSYKVFRQGDFVYQVRFESFEQVSGYSLPKKITIENPGAHVSLIVEYAEADVNVPIPDRAFSIPSGEDAR